MTTIMTTTTTNDKHYNNNDGNDDDEDNNNENQYSLELWLHDVCTYLPVAWSLLPDLCRINEEMQTQIM